MSSIVDNNNVLKYLTKNKEIKSFKKIEKIIGRSFFSFDEWKYAKKN